MIPHEPAEAAGTSNSASTRRPNKPAIRRRRLVDSAPRSYAPRRRLPRPGVAGLTQLLSIAPESVLHVGDQFLNTGNDYEARGSCPCLWIISPTETKKVMKNMLLYALQLRGGTLKSGPNTAASHAA